MKLVFSRRNSYNPIANTSDEFACLDVMVNRKEEYQIAVLLFEDAITGLKKLLDSKNELKHRFTVMRSMAELPNPKPALNKTMTPLPVETVQGAPIPAPKKTKKIIKPEE